MRRLLPFSSVTFVLTLGCLAFCPQARAATIDCSSSSHLDCTPCCGSTNCVCSTPSGVTCSSGSVDDAWANTRLCWRTGILFENTSSTHAAEVDLLYAALVCDPVCIGPQVQKQAEITVPAGGTVSMHVDQYFGLNRHFGTVYYQVKLGDPDVTVLRSDTFDCSDYEIDQATTCN
jgi:hypothetical protein